jgi:hypothetical protein
MAGEPPDGYDFFAPTPVVGQDSTAALRAGTPSHLAPKSSRWAKSDTTFGPAGRVVSTVLLLLPLIFFVGTGLFTMDPFVLVGAVIWTVLAVKGLRQVWRPVAEHHRR